MMSGGCILSRIGLLAIIIVGMIIVMCPVHSWTKDITGGRRAIPNPQNNKELLELSNFAVNQYNSKQGSQLEFVSLVSAEEQVVSGILYYLTLQAKSGSETHEYEAQVWVQAWRNFKSLESFTLKQ